MDDLIHALKWVPKGMELRDPMAELLKNADQTPPERAKYFVASWEEQILLQAAFVLRARDCLPERQTEDAQRFLADAIMSIVQEETSSESDERQR